MNTNLKSKRKKTYRNRLSLLKDSFNEDVRIVSEPKTASSTIQHLTNSLWHIHYFGIPVQEFRPIAISTRIRRIFRSLINRYFFYCFKFKAKFLNEPVKIISCVRPQEDRVTSDFFYNLEYRLVKFRMHIESSYRLKNYTNIIEDLYFESIEYWEKMYQKYDYFDREIKELTGIDVYAVPFDKSKGFQIYKKNNFELMIIKSSHINQLTKEISNFSGNKAFDDTPKNHSSQKWYYSIYKEFYTDSVKSAVKERFKNTKYSTHFYGN